MHFNAVAVVVLFLYSVSFALIVTFYLNFLLLYFNFFVLCKYVSSGTW